MKNKKFRAALAAAVLFTIAVVVVVSCQKIVDVQQTENTIVDDESKTIVERIIAFKKRMELYRNNPGLKTEQKYTADSAVTELEDLINFDFGYGILQVDKQEIVYSEITMPLDSSSKIGESDLSTFYYYQLIVEIQNQMLGLSGYDSIKLMFVDLKHKETIGDGDAVISINSVIGNKGVVTIQSSEEGWWFGKKGGDCDDNYIGILDATILLEQELNQGHNDPPPSGYIWRWKDINILGPLEPMNPDYINPDDDDAEDNYQDRLIFYANSEFSDGVLTNDDKCLSTDSEIGWNLEMDFYYGSYFTIGYDFMLKKNGNETFTEIVEYDGVDPFNENNAIVKHTLQITSSYRYAGNMVAIKDILEYE
ncbi:MAG: hypothetical protein L3J66_06025 [Bacteroidales bacterium]|nr:hypothetical protein [Bacteroidales bacterium]